MESQNKAILKHLKSGKSITAIEAFVLYGLLSCGSRIFYLRRAGHNIKTTMIEKNGKRFAKYSLVK